MLAPLLTAIIVFGYAGGLWWLLRRESREALLAVLVLCGLSLALRLVYTGDFPAGFDEDEPKTFACVAVSLRLGRVFGPDCTGLPALLTALFRSQLVPLLGTGFWAMRLYPMVMSVLSTPAAFASAIIPPSRRVRCRLMVPSRLSSLYWSLFLTL